jgi:hypothetical protein
LQLGQHARRLALNYEYQTAITSRRGSWKQCWRRTEATVTSDTGEVTYLVLADRAAPYLLARVRWPDVAQVITANCPDWLDDPGLFDLPYDPNAVKVSFTQATSVAAGWGRQLRAEADVGVPSMVRRMPVNWSDLSPAERDGLGLESARRRRVSARRLRRLRSSQAKTGAWGSVTAPGNGHPAALAGEPAGAGADGPASNGRSQVASITNGAGSAAPERQHHVRVRVDGRAHICCGHATISAALVDLGEGGMRCVLPDTSPVLAPGATLDGPFLLEAEVATSRICLAVAGRIGWNRSSSDGTHFGVEFGDLDDREAEGVRRFLIAAGSRRGSR